ncbi:MAG: aminotransferase class IV [Cryobacterium sp.]|nr:aminotransferase class IV [Cryobacterium sp.]
MSSATVYRWADGALELLDFCDPADESVEAADSWLVHDGRALALDLHRARFADAVLARGFGGLDLTPFWSAVIAAIPAEGSWFPRIELVSRGGGSHLRYRHREAPELAISIALATHTGEDPRTDPRVKGPDLEAMTALRTGARIRGADDAVLLSPEGYIVEGATTSLVWWSDDELCVVAHELPRIASVTERSLIALALALGLTVREQLVRPGDLDGREIWALNALHGIRIVTAWADGPDTAELPGRLRLWRDRLSALPKPLPSLA